MTKRPAITLLLAPLAVLLLPTAHAQVTLQPGVSFETGPNSAITLNLGQDYTINDTITFDTTGGTGGGGVGPKLNNYTFDARAQPLTGFTWNLTTYRLDNITLTGTPSNAGYMTMYGLEGNWLAKGLYSNVLFFTAGTELEVPSGPKTIYFTPFQFTALTPQEAAEVTAMTAFFNQPFIHLAPYIAGLILGIILIPKTKGILHAGMITLGAFLGLFSVVLSKTDIDNVATYATPIIAISYTALVLYALLHTIKESVNPSPT